MQTFLPYPNFIGSAKVLDSKRLGKQRVENLQIMQALLGKRVGNTHYLVPSGAFETKYFDKDDNEIALSDLDVFDSWREQKVPIQHLTPRPKSEWTIEDYESKGWTSHPAVLMWRGYEHVLMAYQHAICDEWVSRGYKDTCRDKTAFLYSQARGEPAGDIPPWIGDDDFHLSHQSNLLRKQPKYYSQFFPNVPDDLPYVWPVAA